VRAPSLSACLYALLALSAGCSAQAPAAIYVTDSSAGTRVVQSMLESVEAGNDDAAADLIERGARIIVQADSPHDLNAETIRRYVLPRLTGCGRRTVRQAYQSGAQVGITAACENAPQRTGLDGRDVSFQIRNGKIHGANTNDGQVLSGNVNG
jgi:hypothetical protein